MSELNQNPEQLARDKIDQMLELAGWLVQSKKKVDISAAKGVAVREYQTDVGPADYVLFVDRKPVGIIEAKREDEGHRLSVVEEQSAEYAKAKLKYLDNDPLPYVYESTGTLTRFTDYRDPKPRGRTAFSFHKPETLAEWLKKEKNLRERFLSMPPLDATGLRPAQKVAIENLEHSFKRNRPKALIQMATGAGKTFTAATFIYRLLKHADAKRILFLVDTKNLGEQAEQEFMTFQPNDDNRKFTELYNVQRLTSSYIASDSQVCISTIQRLYAILKGEELDESAELANPADNTWMRQQMKKKREKHLPKINRSDCPHFIPNTWVWCNLGEVTWFINGDRSKNYPNRTEYVESGVPWINTGHIEPDGFLSTERMNYITREKFDSLKSGKIEIGDLLYCLRGATFGKTAYVTQYSEGAIASSLMIIRSTDKINKVYLYHFLTSVEGKRQLQRFDNGTAQPNLSANMVRSYAFPLPPDKEQHQIVREIESRLSVCDKVEKTIAESLGKAEALRQSILKKAFEGELLTEEELASCRQEADWEPALKLLERVKNERSMN